MLWWGSSHGNNRSFFTFFFISHDRGVGVVVNVGTITLITSLASQFLAPSPAHGKSFAGIFFLMSLPPRFDSVQINLNVNPIPGSTAARRAVPGRHIPEDERSTTPGGKMARSVPLRIPSPVFGSSGRQSFVSQVPPTLSSSVFFTATPPVRRELQYYSYQEKSKRSPGGSYPIHYNGHQYGETVALSGQTDSREKNAATAIFIVSVPRTDKCGCDKKKAKEI
ncbi:hypothetical protein QBC40DRAFT_295874 [Triangularia verruculosa]|uniref:Uncharacterized protein n=1 Tax=Triangularia verruculosa TaxID=2587418 RepID=A0AAN6XJA2_9PEZI|nr:hypothetical protein QBC40DRAFT_295874 [Triangularia verruculosa]